MKPIINNAAIQLPAPGGGDTRPRNAFGVLTGFGEAYSAHYAAEDKCKAATFEGHHSGVRFTCSPHRYGKGMVLALENDVRDEWKTRAVWLAEALGGKWARGHQRGYRIAPTRALQWRAFYMAGWDADVPCFSRKITFHLGEGPKLTLKEALASLANPVPN